MNFFHKSVLLKESVEALHLKSDGIYIDATAGGGGHSELILDKLKGGLLISIDQDPDAVLFLKEKFKRYNNSIVINSNFSQIAEIVNRLSVKKVDGVLFDLGVSSYQLDTPERGFSYHHNALLDMRMSKAGLSAYEVVNEFSKNDLLKIIREYGEEKYAVPIVNGIVKFRSTNKIETTKDLAEIIKQSIPISARRKSNHHPARKTFQAIRIAVNDEFLCLTKGLDSAFSVLNEKGRIAVITFHSLEDRIVKQKMAKWCEGCTCPPEFPICVCNKSPDVKIVNKKPIVPSQEEIKINFRSRSSKLRVCEKL